MGMFQWLADGPATDVDLAVASCRLVAALVLGVVVSLTYFVSQRRSAGDVYPVAATMVLLTVLVAMTALVIGNSVARAFTLVGALSIVRFRTSLEDARDTAFVVFAVVTGMAAGAGYLAICVPGVPLVGIAAAGLHWMEGRTALLGPERKLSLRLARDLDPEIVLGDVFLEHLASRRIVYAGTAKQGQSLDLQYSVQLRRADGLLAFLQAVSRREGIESADFKDA